MAEDDQSRIRTNHRGTYDRLAQVKRTYDPGDIVRHNQDIVPA